MRGRRRAVVIGGSMSGLFSGLMLLQAGWVVDVFERLAGELAGRGAGIVAQPGLIAALRRLGIDTGALGVSTVVRRMFAADGRLTERLALAQVMTSWERTFRLLRDAFPAAQYHRARELTGFTQTADSVVAHFAGGDMVEADLLVGADGIRSNVRQLCLPALAPRYAGYVAWRALVPEARLPPPVHDDLFDAMAFCLPRNEQFLGYPVAGPDDDLRPGHRRYNAVWYRPATERDELRRLLTDASGVTHDLSIPPPLIRGEAIAEMRGAAQTLLAPQMREVVRQIDEPLLQPIYDLESPSMAFGRVAIIGDAAFVARPHVGAGVVKAADDAAALAAALLANDDVAAALNAFDAERRPIGVRIIERARHLGAYLQAERGMEDEIHSARHSVPQAVLRETATLDFLQA